MPRIVLVPQLAPAEALRVHHPFRAEEPLDELVLGHLERGVLMHTGETTRAEELLAGIERFIAPLPRMNVDGYGVADAQVHAIRGDLDRARAALRTAVKEGWRSDWRYYRDFDPSFAALRRDPQFVAIFRELAADITAQRARVAATRTATPPRPAPSTR